MKVQKIYKNSRKTARKDINFAKNIKISFEKFPIVEKKIKQKCVKGQKNRKISEKTVKNFTKMR